MPELNRTQWDDFLAGYPDAHLLQSGAWAELKRGFGWRSRWILHGKTGAQVLFRPIRLGFSIAYLPKGPVGSDWAALWPEVAAACRRERAVFLKVEPDEWEPAAPDLQPARLPGFTPSPHAIQPPRTIRIRLDGDEEALLGRMKQKTRYNIRLAQKKGVTVRQSADVSVFQKMMVATGERDGFGVHSLEYYRRAYQLFSSRGECALLQAEYNGEPLAALMAFRRGRRAWYFYGASTELERSRMPAYLLQWEAMNWARAQGCCEYDLWGVPDEDEQVLEERFSGRSDGLWGVYRFKRGFGGEVCRSVGAWDRVYQPVLYRVYRWWLDRRGSPTTD